MVLMGGECGGEGANYRLILVKPIEKPKVKVIVLMSVLTVLGQKHYLSFRYCSLKLRFLAEFSDLLTFICTCDALSLP